MNKVNPFIPDSGFLERRTSQMVARRHRPASEWDRDRDLGGKGFADLIDKQRGQLAEVFIRGGRWGSYERKAALKQLIEIAALAERAAAVVMAEIHEAHGEHVDDDLREMFDLDEKVMNGAPREGTASPREQTSEPF